MCNPETSIFSGTIELVRGLMRFRARPGGLDVTVSTRAAAIGIRGTEFDLLATSRATEIAVYEGSIEVTSPTGSVRVGAGEVVRVTAATAPVVGTAPTGSIGSGGCALGSAAAGRYRTCLRTAHRADRGGACRAAARRRDPARPGAT